MITSRFTVSTRCECQANLTAELDERRHALAGWAYRSGVRESAPAHSIHPELERFDIAWMCNFCGRNVLRSFYAGALRPLKDDAAAQPAEVEGVTPTT